MGITRASAKLKGAEFQRWVRDKILSLYPQLHPDDVTTAVGGQNGEDIKLSPAARLLFPFSVECKRIAKIAIYGWYEQAVANAGKSQPLLIVRGDRKKALAVVDAEYFFNLVIQASK
jgi:hypothetical protein